MVINCLKKFILSISSKPLVAGTPEWFRKTEIKNKLSTLSELKKYIDIANISTITLKFNNLIMVENQGEIFEVLDKLEIDKKYFVLGSYFGVDYIETFDNKKYLYIKIYDRNVDREVIFKEIEEDIKFSNIDHNLLCYKDGIIYPILEKSEKTPLKVDLSRIKKKKY